MEALNEQVGRIGAVADMISEIAAKTNLLALNATIEAARAGDAGKGFAVVASEVKALATQTASSTQEIGRHIDEVRAATGASAAAVRRIEQTIGEINAIAGSIAAAVEEQGAATAEIARNVAETATAANEMTGQISEVSSEAERTDQHAGAVQDNASGLNAAVSELKQSLIRVVRTSTADVDRRIVTRHQVDLPCRLTVERPHPCCPSYRSFGGWRALARCSSVAEWRSWDSAWMAWAFHCPSSCRTLQSGAWSSIWTPRPPRRFRGVPERLVSRRAA